MCQVALIVYTSWQDEQGSPDEDELLELCCGPLLSTEFSTTEQQERSKLVTPQPSSPELPPRKKVQFAADAEIIPAASPLDQFEAAAAVASTIWYQSHDLSFFRNQARNASRQLRTQIPPNAGPQLAANDQTRGFEQRTCLERQKRRFWTRRLVLTHQVANIHHRNDPEHLAALYKHVTAYASELATEEAARDYVRAYYYYDEAAGVAGLGQKHSLNKGGGNPHHLAGEGADRRVRRRVA